MGKEGERGEGEGKERIGRLNRKGSEEGEEGYGKWKRLLSTVLGRVRRAGVRQAAEEEVGRTR